MFVMMTDDVLLPVDLIEIQIDLPLDNFTHSSKTSDAISSTSLAEQWPLSKCLQISRNLEASGLRFRFGSPTGGIDGKYVVGGRFSIIMAKKKRYYI